MIEPDDLSKAAYMCVRCLRSVRSPIDRDYQLTTADLVEALSADRDDLRAKLSDLAKMTQFLIAEARRAGLEEAAKIAEESVTGEHSYYGKGGDDRARDIAECIRDAIDAPQDAA